MLAKSNIIHSGCEQRRGGRDSQRYVGEGGGIATYRGMSAHPIIGGSPLYLALKLCHKVAHNPNIDLLILTFACTYINKKLCLKMFFFTKIAIMCVAHLHSGIVYYKLCRERSYAFAN